MTADEILIHVQALSELEKADFIENLVEHLSRNKQLHLIENCYEWDNIVEGELREEIFRLEQEITELVFNKQVLESVIEKEREKNESRVNN